MHTFVIFVIVLSYLFIDFKDLISFFPLYFRITVGEINGCVEVILVDFICIFYQFNCPQ